MTSSLIIPAYNEEKRLGSFLSSIADYLHQSAARIDEIIIVNDGSTDRTADVAAAYQETLPQLNVLTHKVNRGKGAAVQTGVLAALSDLVVFTDADGATPISELPKMIAALQQSDMAVGNRWLPGAKTTRHSLLRRFSGFVYRTYMRLFGLGAIDTMCGFKGFRRTTAHELFQNLQEPGWLFDAEICYQAVRGNVRIKNFPISWESKDGSKLDTATLFKTALQIWPLIARLRQEKTAV